MDESDGEMGEQAGANTERDATGVEPADAGLRRTLAGPDGDLDPLVAFAAGSFHAALVMVAILGLLHGSGDLGDALGGLGTLPGAAAYLALWAVAWWTTRRGVATAVDRGGGVVAALLAGLAWGAVAGVTFLVAVGGVGGIVLLFDASTEFPTVLLILGIGSAAAAVVGSLVGGVLALADVALLGVAVRVAEVGARGGGSSRSAEEEI